MDKKEYSYEHGALYADKQVIASLDGTPFYCNLTQAEQAALGESMAREHNAHDELVAALRQIVIEATESPNSDANRVETIREQARAALAKAGAA